MKIAGVAPKIAIPTFIYLLITVIIDYLEYPFFKISLNNYVTLIVVGAILLLVGISMIMNVARRLLKSFKSNILMTDGLFLVFRNPMYAAYLIFILPGIALLFNSWLVLTSVIINYILLQRFIKEEYRYLEEKYDGEYKSYLNKVWIKFL